MALITMGKACKCGSTEGIETRKTCSNGMVHTAIICNGCGGNTIPLWIPHSSLSEPIGDLPDYDHIKEFFEKQEAGVCIILKRNT